MDLEYTQHLFDRSTHALGDCRTMKSNPLQEEANSHSQTLYIIMLIILLNYLLTKKSFD